MKCRIFTTRKCCLILLLSLALQGVAFASPAKEEDFGIWNSYDIEKKLTDKWKIKIGDEMRYRSHNGLYHQETRFGASYQAWKWLTLGNEYLEIRSERAVGKKDIWSWAFEQRYFMTPKAVYKGFTLEDRNMVCVRNRQDTRAIFIYRNMVTLTLPWKWTRFEFQPYTANEIFIETHKKGLCEDRFYAGFKEHWWGPFYGSIFYLRQATKNSKREWKALNILGISLKYSF